MMVLRKEDACCNIQDKDAGVGVFCGLVNFDSEGEGFQKVCFALNLLLT